LVTIQLNDHKEGNWGGGGGKKKKGEGGGGGGGGGIKSSEMWEGKEDTKERGFIGHPC